MPLQTNLLAVPKIHVTIETSNTEDWVDSFKYLIGPVDPLDLDPPQLDLRGIEFDMEVRRNATDHEVVLQASTGDGTLIIGTSPDFGYLIIRIPADEMVLQSAGTYVADIRGRDTPFDQTRRCTTIDLKILEGVTK